MSRRTPWGALIHTRALVLLTVMGMLGTLLAVVVPPVTAAAAGTVLFDNTFYNRTVDGTGTVTTPTPTSGTNVACLSASGNSTTGPLLSCPTSSDVQGSGKLRLTAATSSQVGGIYGAASFPSSNGLDVTFNSYQYGGGGGDGMSFVLAAIDPANPAPPTTIGPSGGSLGYSPAGNVRGLPNAYLGVGLDPFGNFSSINFQGSGCTNVTNITAQTPGAVVVRGPGNGLAGYCGLTTTYDGTAASKVILRATTRAAAGVPVQVLVNPTAASYTSSTGVTVTAGTYKVVVTPVGQATKVLTGPLPAASPTLYPATTWVNASGVPKQLAFGFVGATGSVVDAHEASNVKVLTFNQVPQLSVATTSYAVAAPGPGAPVNYVVNSSVATGAAVTKQISMTQTAPAGVRLLAAYGSGWVCSDPVGQTVSCSTSGSSFAAGTTLPPVNVVAIVTATGITSTFIQNNSSATVSSADSNPGSNSTTTAGTTPAPPSGVAVSPSSGTVAGGTTVTVTGSSTAAPTAVEIGTTAEFQTGNVATLLPCATGDTTNCFAISGTSVLVYLPARSTPGTVSIAQVTLGVSGSASYVYTDKPATVATPTATAGLSSATVTWVAPADNGRTITGYVITPYLSGAAQTPVTVDPAAVTRVISGLTAGSSYTFTVAAVNALGTSTPSSQSAAVVPYTAINAPTIGTVTAGTSAVTVRWTAPTSTGGSPITAYVVTPYIGTVAQTPQTFAGSATTQTLTGLTPGTAYTFKVAARSLSGTNVLYRVNAGGPQLTAIDGGLNWAADAGTDNPLRNSGSLTTAPGPSATFDSTVPSTTPSGIFDTDRYDPGSKGNADEMSWAFPVTSGNTVKVRLYFANRYVPTGQPGNRVFDVSLEGGKVLDQFDMVTAAGGDQRATMREFTVTSDGTVNIDFTHEVENPQINGIEIIQTGLLLTGPMSAASFSATPNAPPALNFAAPPAGEVNLAYSNQLAVTGGTSPYIWSVSSGALPTGLTLSASTGLLSGTPTAAGTFNSTIQVVDVSGVSATKTVTLTIYPALVLTFAPTAGEISVPYGYQPVRSGGSGSYSWAVSAGSLPSGVILNSSTGLISGTPTGDGDFSVTIAVTDALQTVSKTGTIVIAPLPTITSGTPAAGQVGVPYSTTFVVSGGTGPFTWAVPAGALPPGLALDPNTGVLSGTPTTVGSSSFTVTVTDAYGKTATKAVTLVVTSGPIVIVKTANASSAVGGAVVSYTITVSNTSTSAFTGVALSDPLSGVLDDAAYDGNAVASTGTVSYASATLSWTGNLAASASATITYSVTVSNPGTGNKVLANTVSSTTLATNCTASSVDARCSATVTVSGLSIVHTASPATTTPGSTVTFTTVVTNTGQTPYVGASYTESLAGILDDATFNGNATATAGNVSYASPTLSWSGNLAVGASATITYSVAVANPDPGNRSLTSTVVSPSAGSTCPSANPAASCTATATVLVPALVITNAASVSTITPGGQVPYTITFSNTGQTAYTNTSVSIAFSAAIDDAVSDANFVASSGTLTFNSTTSVFTWTGNLAIGAVVTITGSVTVRNPDPGDRSVVTVATSAAAGSTCRTGALAAACTSTVQVLVPQLTIAKSSTVSTTTPGSVVNYTVTATNAGQTNYTGATFTDALTGVIDDATFNGNAAASSGSVTFTSPNLIWTGDLAIGATATITYSVTVRQPDPGNLTLTSAVTSTTAGNNCPAGGNDVRCSNAVTVLIPGLAIATTTDVSTAIPGQVVRYSISVTNTGQTAYTSVGVNLNFLGVYDDATNNNDGTTSTGNLQVNPDGTVVWILSLAPGASATGTSSFTVNSPATGNRSMVSTAASDAAGSTCPTGSANAACRSTVTVQIPGLTITKTAGSSSVVTGGTVNYTIVVTNTGESTYAAAAFNDSLATVLTDAVYSGGATATAGTVSYAAPNLSWSGSLTPGATATISYAVVVRDPDPGDKRMTNTVVSTSPGSNCPAGATDPRCTAVVNVLVPGLTVTKSASASSTTPGATLGYTVTVTNSGATPYTGATFSDPLAGVLDDATYNANVATTSGTVGYANSAINWTGNLAVGASANITYSVTVHAVDDGNDLLSNTVVSSTGGSNCAPASVDARCTVVVPVARLVLAYGPIAPTARPGDVLFLTATYTNTGQVPYTDISVAVLAPDAVDDGVSGVQTTSSGTLTIGAAGITWNGSIPIGGVVNLTATMGIQNPDLGDRYIKSTIVSSAPGNNCPDGGSDPRCVFEVRVVVPGLSITKSVNASQVAPGGVVTYTVTVANTGQTPYLGAVVTDSLAGVLDDASYAGGASATRGSVAYASPSLTWTGDLDIAQTAVITYSVSVKSPNTGDNHLVNRVSSTEVGSTCPPNSGIASCGASVDVLVPAMTIVKSAGTAATTLGAVVTYTVTVTNSGQTTYPAATVTDPLTGVLDDATYNNNAAATTGTVSYANPTLTWTGSLIPAQAVTITYTVTLKNPATGDLRLTNAATSTNEGNNCTPGSLDSRCTTLVDVTNSVALSIVKSANVTGTVPGARVTFTLRLTNPTGTTIFGANITDNLAGILDDATYTSATANVGTVSYSSPNVTWTGNVAARRTVNVTYTVTVKPIGSEDVGNELLTATTVSTSPATSNNCLAGSADPSCTVTVPVARLDLRQFAGTSTATPGSVFQVSTTYTNTGQVPYTGITITSPRANTSDDTIPTGEQTVSSGSLTTTATAVIWTGDIPIGTTITTTRILTVKNPDPGNQLVTATLQSDAPGNNCPTGGTTDANCTYTVTVLTPALTVAKTADSAFIQPGGTVRYTITITNSGQSPYTAARVTDTLTGVLDDADYNNNATTTTGSLQYAAPTLTWTGDLAVGQTTTVSFTVTSRSLGTGDKAMINTVQSSEPGSTCPPASGNSACRATVAVLTPALTIVKASDLANATLGSTVTYTVKVTNSGQTYYPAATFADPLAGLLDDAAYQADAVVTSGAVDYQSSVLSWTGALVPGQSATITYSVRINNPDTGDRTMANTVTSTTPGNNCVANSTDARCTASVTVTNAVSLTITKTANVVSTVAGATVTYSVAVINSSGATITGANFSDPLTGLLDDASYNGNASAPSGVVSYEATILTWTGDVAAGATVTVTYSVVVNNPVAGDLILDGTVTSTALLQSNNCVAGSTDPRCRTTVPVARLVIAYGPIAPTAVPGQRLHLTQTYTNTGKVPYVGISVETLAPDVGDDSIPGVQAASSGTLSVGANGITWTGDIAVGATIYLTADTQVKNPDTGDRFIKGTSVSTAPGNNCPAGGTDPRCTFTINVKVPGLTITKSANRTSVAPGESVGFTIVLRNTGETPYVGAVATDSLLGVLDEGTLDAAPTASAGAAVVEDESLSWTGNLAVGEVVTVSYSVTATGTSTGDKWMLNTVTSAETGSTCPVNAGAAECSVQVQVLTPGLTLVKSADTATTTLGAVVSYTVSVTNSGQTSYPTAMFTDPLVGVLDDADYLPAATTTSSGEVSFTDGVLGWTGALTPGQSATITYSVSVRNPSTGDRMLTNTVTSTTAGSNCAAGRADTRCTDTVEVLNTVALSIVKTASSVSTVPGGIVVFTLRLTNPTDITIFGANITDNLTGILDDATYTSATANVGTVTYTDPNLTWTGNVAARRTVTITYTVTVKPAGTTDTGNDLLTAKTVSTSPTTSNNCLTGSTDPDCLTTVPIARLDLRQFANTPTATPGSVFQVTSIYTNTGQVPYSGISVSSPRADTSDDTVPTGDQTASSGTVIRTADALVWTGDIPVGGVVTITRTLIVKNPDPGNQLIIATLQSAAPGNNCPTAGTTDPRCTYTVTVVTPKLTISKSANTPATAPGGTVGYTITIANTGQTPYTAASVTDTLTGVLDDADYNNNATASIGQVAFSSPTLTWTGDLATGQTTVINYTVTTHSPATADKTMINRVASNAVGSTCPPASGDPACRTTTIVLTPALRLETKASKTTVLPGDTVTYTTAVTNTGQTFYPAATFADSLAGLLDDATYQANGAATTGTVDSQNGVLTWTGSLAPGASATITYTVVVANPVTGDHLLTHGLTSTSQGANCLSGGTDARCLSTIPIASLQIVNSADVTTTEPTKTVHYTGTFTNTGQVPYVGISISASFVGALDDASYGGDAATSSGSVLAAVGSGRIIWTGDVPVGATVYVTGSVTVNNPDLGNRVLTTIITTSADATNCPVGGTDPVCRVDIPVAIPALTITNTPSSTSTEPGGKVSYTLTISNTGQTTYPAATVGNTLTGLLDDATYDNNATAATGTVSFTSPVLTWTGSLISGQTVVITYSVTVNNPDFGDKIMVDQLSSANVGSSCPPGSPSSACSTTVTVLIPAIALSVVADTATTVPGATVGYTVTIRNTGQTNAPTASVNISLAGALDDATYTGSATTTLGTTAYAAPVLTWSGNLPVGATAIVTYTVTVARPDVGNRMLTTTLTSTSPGSPCSSPGGPDASCTSTVTVLIPGLALHTTVSTATATQGGPVVFTLTIQNTGQTVYSAAVVTTSLSNVLDDATFAGTTSATAGVVTYAAPTLTWTGDLAIGASATVTYTVTVHNPNDGDKLMSATAVSTMAGSNCPVGSSNSLCTATVRVLTLHLSLAQTASAPTSTPGGVVTYTITVVNDGEAGYAQARATVNMMDVLADATYNANASVVGGGTLSYTGVTLSWVGNLPVGASATITYSVTIRNPDPGDKLLTNRVTSTSTGSTCPAAVPEAACTVVVQVLVPGLSITKTADKSIVIAGSAVQYTVTLRNTGETAYEPATFTDSLSGVLDDATYSGNAVASSGSVSYVNNTLVWSGPLAVGTTATITYSVTATFPAVGDKTLANIVQSNSTGSTCPAASSNASCRTSVSVVVPKLTISKTADTSRIVAGGTIKYTLTATNTGAADYPLATLTDSLVEVLDEGVYNGDAMTNIGAMSYANQTLSWAGALTRGATVVITFSLKINSNVTGDATLDNRVVSTSVGSTCPPNSVNPACVVATEVEATQISLTDLTQSFALGGVPGSTVTLEDAVSMTVTTNSFGGYAVTVQGTDDQLHSADGGSDTIPLNLLSVRETGTGLYNPLSSDEGVTVHRQNGPSAPRGDAVSNDFQVQIPDVASGTYSTTLEYIATAQ